MKSLKVVLAGVIVSSILSACGMTTPVVQAPSNEKKAETQAKPKGVPPIMGTVEFVEQKDFLVPLEISYKPLSYTMSPGRDQFIGEITLKANVDLWVEDLTTSFYGNFRKFGVVTAVGWFQGTRQIVQIDDINTDYDTKHVSRINGTGIQKIVKGSSVVLTLRGNTSGIKGPYTAGTVAFEPYINGITFSYLIENKVYKTSIEFGNPIANLNY